MPEKYFEQDHQSHVENSSLGLYIIHEN